MDLKRLLKLRRPREVVAPADAPRNLTFEPGDWIPLGECEFRVSSHPASASFAFASEGRTGTVYQVADVQGDLHALKVFKSAFRQGDFRLEHGLSRIAALGLPGLRALDRTLLTEDHPAAKRFPNLKGAVLMPWIAGSTWFDCLDGAQGGDFILDPTDALSLAIRFIHILMQLEVKKITHADISPANVILDLHNFIIELIDLEDMYFEGAIPQSHQNIGTDGYRSYSVDQGETHWGPYADRYAGPVLAAEILALSDRGMASLATTEGVFQNNRSDKAACDRFSAAQAYFATFCPNFGATFWQTWHAQSLRASPTLSDYYVALMGDRSYALLRSGTFIPSF